MHTYQDARNTSIYSYIPSFFFIHLLAGGSLARGATDRPHDVIFLTKKGLVLVVSRVRPRYLSVLSQPLISSRQHFIFFKDYLALINSTQTTTTATMN